MYSSHTISVNNLTKKTPRGYKREKLTQYRNFHTVKSGIPNRNGEKTIPQKLEQK